MDSPGGGLTDVAMLSPCGDASLSPSDNSKEFVTESIYLIALYISIDPHLPHILTNAVMLGIENTAYEKGP